MFEAFTEFPLLTYILPNVHMAYKPDSHPSKILFTDIPGIGVLGCEQNPVELYSYRPSLYADRSLQEHIIDSFTVW